jgi:MFS superfamily sulfate permease-like transporter
VTDPNNLDSFQLSVQKRYNRAAASLAFLVAVLYTAVGILRLGFMMRFLSFPIITGFTTGASILIGVAQVGAYVIQKCRTPLAAMAIEFRSGMGLTSLCHHSAVYHL